MTLSLIAAVASNGVIGLNGGIPWHIPEDMAYFKRVTMGHRVIMGSNTFMSLPNLLKGRQNIVVSGNTPKDVLEEYTETKEFHVCTSVEQALALPQWGEHEEVFCIGGAKLYAAMMPLADKLYLTEIGKEFEGDTFMPPFEEAKWKLMHSKLGDKVQEVGFDYYFSVYERVNGH